jgi:hypothetical protein
MARWTWSNVVVTPNDAMGSPPDTGPGLEALGDLALDGAYRGTMRIRLHKSDIDGLVSLDNCEFLSFRPAAQAGGGARTRAVNATQVVSDTTDIDGTPFPGVTMTADFQARPGTTGPYTTQGTLTWKLYIGDDGGVKGPNYDFAGPFERTVA